MDKRTVLLTILIFALIAAGVYNFYHFSGRRKPRSASVVPQPKLATTKRKTNKNPEKPIRNVTLKASPQNVLLTLPKGWGRNPFLTLAEIKQIQAAENPPPPPPKKEPEPIRPLPEYMVTSILISGAQKVAVIDGEIVSPGDFIGREIVKEISTEGVVLAMGSNRRTIKLRQSRTKIKTKH